MAAVARVDGGRCDPGAVRVRIVVTGPESTGKSTLAQLLGERLHAPVVPEAARLYAEALSARTPGATLTAADVAPIARLALSLDDHAMAAQPGTVVCDTDLVSTVVYARHYYGDVPAWVETAARERRGDLYLLCATDLPWTPDAVRDRPLHRDTLLQAFRDALHAFDCTVAWVAGTGDARVEQAWEAIARHQAAPLAAPLAAPHAREERS